MGNGRISAKQAEILEYIKAQILEKGYRENPDYNPRNAFAKKEFYPGRK